MTHLELDKKKIYEYQQNREPYLMIDHATEVLPGKSAKGYKDFDSDEWFFKVHWKNDPNVPGMLQIEALVQMSALSILTLPGNKGKIVYLTGANNLRFLSFTLLLPNRAGITIPIFFLSISFMIYQHTLSMLKSL